MWSHDYCTVCDKQCPPGTMYCSDACRVSELHKSCEVSSASDSVYSALYTTCRHHSLSSPLPACDGADCTSTACFCTTTTQQLSSPLALPATGSSTDYYTQQFYNPFSTSSSPSTPELSPALTASSASPLSIQSNDYFFNTARASSSSSKGSATALSSPPPSPLMIPSGSYYGSKPVHTQSAASHKRHHMGPRKLSDGAPGTVAPGSSLASEYTSTSTNYRRWLAAV